MDFNKKYIKISGSIFIVAFLILFFFSLDSYCQINDSLIFETEISFNSGKNIIVPITNDDLRINLLKQQINLAKSKNYTLSKVEINGNFDFVEIKTNNATNLSQTRCVASQNFIKNILSEFGIKNYGDKNIYQFTVNKNIDWNYVFKKIYKLNPNEANFAVTVLKQDEYRINNDKEFFKNYNQNESMLQLLRTSTIKLIFIKQLENAQSKPIIQILQPKVNRGFKELVISENLEILVLVTDLIVIKEVSINKIQANFIGNNTFRAVIPLKYGDNTIIVNAINEKNISATEQFQIERATNTINNSQIKVQNDTFKIQGKYFAFLIGNNDYLDKSIVKLEHPINDAINLFTILTSIYTFDKENVILLKNGKYEDIINVFDSLSKIVTEYDNLLIFYAGHGYWDKEKNLGYWLPCDAKRENTAHWLRNSTISDYLGSIKSKHTLLIADACFSGSIFKTRTAFDDAPQAINKLYELSSRKAMTSGNLKTVPDKSIFLEYLTKKLVENKEKYLSADQLFSSIRQAIMNNSQTEPQYGTVQNAGDWGGEFILIRK